MLLYKKPLQIILALAFIFLPAGAGQAYAAQPGSQDDPLVSQSYVDSKFNQLVTMILGGSGTETKTMDYDEIVSDVMAQIVFLYGDILNTAGTPSQIQSGGLYVPVQAKAGQTIIGGEGTEIILRSGKAVAYCPGQNGVVDVTEGNDLLHNRSVKVNHMLIVPRADGRGVQATADAWFIIKGSYSFLQY